MGEGEWRERTSSRSSSRQCPSVSTVTSPFELSTLHHCVFESSYHPRLPEGIKEEVKEIHQEYTHSLKLGFIISTLRLMRMRHCRRFRRVRGRGRRRGRGKWRGRECIVDRRVVLVASGVCAGEREGGDADGTRTARRRRRRVFVTSSPRRHVPRVCRRRRVESRERGARKRGANGDGSVHSTLTNK